MPERVRGTIDPSLQENRDTEPEGEQRLGNSIELGIDHEDATSEKHPGTPTRRAETFLVYAASLSLNHSTTIDNE